MKYTIKPIDIPKEQRKEVNEKLLSIIDTHEKNGLHGITAEEIMAAYTGIGGLHGYNFSDFDSYHRYKVAKMDFEEGQFFTPTDVCKEITDLFPISEKDLILEMCCGMGNFFNGIIGRTNEHNIFGCEIEQNAFKVAKFLYPNANIENIDIRLYQPKLRFDYAFGNPPFNLRWNVGSSTISSQEYFCQRVALALKPFGIMAVIMPEKWLSDAFFNSRQISELNDRFSHICSFSLPKNVQRKYGTDFPVKVCVFYKIPKGYFFAKGITFTPFSPEICTIDEAKTHIENFLSFKEKNKRVVSRATSISEDNTFLEKVKKYLYEIKTHKSISKHYQQALTYVDSLVTQTVPAHIAAIRDGDQRQKEWDKVRITEPKVLAYLKRIIKQQTPKKRKEKHTHLTNYELVEYDKTVNHLGKVEVSKKVTPIYDLVQTNRTFGNKQIDKRIGKKRNNYNLSVIPFSEMQRCEKVDAFMRNFIFYKKAKAKKDDISPDGQINKPELIACKFNEIQLHDAGLLAQKYYAAINWSPGAGKTGVSYAIMKWHETQVKIKNTFIISPAVAINLTWRNFLTLQNQSFIHIKKVSDIAKIKEGDYCLLSNEMLVKYQKHIKQHIKECSYKIAVIFDESDEMTNHASRRTKAAIACFSRARRKLLTTGTLTRNRISELYSQLRILYNNSMNMICRPETCYEEQKVKILVNGKERTVTQIRKYDNKQVDKPFSAKRGNKLFNDCFNPSRTSIFGKQKQEQDIYNRYELSDIIAHTVITRKFKEIAGDKYKIHNIEIIPSREERAFYQKVLTDTENMIRQYFTISDNSRKESLLRMLRMMNLLILATSLRKESIGHCAKAYYIIEELLMNWNERVAIGCITVEAVECYESLIKDFMPDLMPERNVYVIKGNISFKKREKIIEAFENDSNGILVCTQQSLRASVNIPSCNKVIIESKQWNIPKMEQWYFRFVRYDSEGFTDIYFISYSDTIEMNILALLMAKEKLNDFIKTLDYKDDDEMYNEFGIDMDILDSLLTREYDKDGNIKISWAGKILT